MGPCQCLLGVSISGPKCPKSTHKKKAICVHFLRACAGSMREPIPQPAAGSEAAQTRANPRPKAKRRDPALLARISMREIRPGCELPCKKKKGKFRSFDQHIVQSEVKRIEDSALAFAFLININRDMVGCWCWELGVGSEAALATRA